MRKLLKIAIVLSAFVVVASTRSLAQQIEIDSDNRTIAVSATDSATEEADMATVHIGFQSFAIDEKTAYANGSKTSNAIAKALADAGVKKEAIESNDQSISRIQQFELQALPPEPKHPMQFVVRQSWTVKTSATEAAGVLNSAVQAGANQSGNIDWDVADPDALEAHAASKAMKRAQQVATRMAEGLGGRLGPLLFASNQLPDGSGPRFQNFATAMKAGGGGGVEPLAINAKKVTRSATVYAVFAIE